MISRMLVLSLAATLACGANSRSARGPLQLLAEWRTVDFAFSSPAHRQHMIKSGEFVPNNVVPIDVDAFGQGNDQRVFVTTPRLKPGVPATLSELTRSDPGHPPRLRPFPDWSWNRQGDCKALNSVFRTMVDPCGRLWVIDSGVVDIFVKSRQACPPKLVIFDLNGLGGQQLDRRYEIPESQQEPGSIFITVAVDVRGRDPRSCREAFAYVADVTNPAIVVYDMYRNRSWRVVSNLFYPYPLNGGFQINGVKFDLMDGVFGLALGPLRNGDRTLYFHSLASVRESWVSTRLLRNESNFGAENLFAFSSQFRVSDPERPSQSAAEGMDSKGVLFFSLLSETALACWDSRQPYTRENLHMVAQDDVNLQFPSGLKVIGGDVWLLTSRFQNVMVDNVNPNEINYRVLRAPIADLVQGTPCQLPGYFNEDLFPGTADSDNEHRVPTAPITGGGLGSYGTSYLPSPTRPISYSSAYISSSPGSFGFPQAAPSVPKPSWSIHRHQGSGGGYSNGNSGADTAIVFRDPVGGYV